MRPERPRITVVNDNPEFLGLMQDLLQDASYPSTLVDGARGNAMELIEASKPDLLIVDLRLGNGGGLHGREILDRARRHPQLRDVPTIVCTADKWALDEIAEELESMPNVATLTKPFAIDELYRIIDLLLGGRA